MLKRWQIKTITVFEQIYLVNAESLADAKTKLDNAEPKEDYELFRHIISARADNETKRR